MTRPNPDTRRDDRYVWEVANEEGGADEIDLRDLDTSCLRKIRDQAWSNQDRDLAARVDEVLDARNA